MSKIINIKIIFLAIIWLALIISFIFMIKEFPSLEHWKKIMVFEKIPYIIMLALCVITAMLLRGFRWWVILKPHFSFPRIKLIFVYGWFFILSIITPLRAGELLRVLWVKQHNGSALIASGNLAIERLLDLLTLLFYFGIAFIFVPSFSLEYIGLSWIVLVFSVYLVVSIFAPKVESFFKYNDVIARVISTHVFFSTINKHLCNFMKGVGSLSHWKLNLKVLLLTLLLWLILAYGFYFFFSKYSLECCLISFDFGKFIWLDWNNTR